MYFAVVGCTIRCDYYCPSESDESALVCSLKRKRVMEARQKFHEYPQWGDDIGAAFVFRQDVGMFFQHSYYEAEVVPHFASA